MRCKRLYIPTPEPGIAKSKLFSHSQTPENNQPLLDSSPVTKQDYSLILLRSMPRRIWRVDYILESPDPDVIESQGGSARFCQSLEDEFIAVAQFADTALKALNKHGTQHPAYIAIFGQQSQPEHALTHLTSMFCTNISDTSSAKRSQALYNTIVELFCKDGNRIFVKALVRFTTSSNSKGN